MIQLPVDALKANTYQPRQKFNDESLESLAVTPIGSEPVIIVADANHPLRGATGIELESLKEESWILMNRPRSIIDAFYQLARARGLESPKVALETSSLDFLKAMTARSSLLSVLPRGAVSADLQAGTLISLAVEDLPVVETGFVHRHGVLPPLVNQAVVAVKAAANAHH